MTFSAEGRRTRMTIRSQSGFTPEWDEMARVGWGEALDKLGYAIADDVKVAAVGEREIERGRAEKRPDSKKRPKRDRAEL